MATYVVVDSDHSEDNDLAAAILNALGGEEGSNEGEADQQAQQPEAEVQETSADG